MSRTLGVRRTARIRSVSALALACSACSWFGKSPPPRPPVAETSASLGADSTEDAQSAEAARAVCPNYAKTFEDTSYPRDAIIRGLDRGSASVRFQVDGSTLTITTVKSSHPAFGDAAVRIVRKLECRVDRRTTFEIPFEWRTGR